MTRFRDSCNWKPRPSQWRNWDENARSQSPVEYWGSGWDLQIAIESSNATDHIRGLQIENEAAHDVLAEKGMGKIRYIKPVVVIIYTYCFCTSVPSRDDF